MHVQVRMLGKPDTIVAVESRLSKIEEFRKKIKEKFGVDPKLQRLFYGGKMLENGYTFHDYNIKINDVIQLMVMVLPKDTSSKSTPVESDKSVKEKKSGDTKKEEDLSADKDAVYQDGNSSYYEIGDFVDVRDLETGAWLEGKIIRIVHNPQATEGDSASNDSDKNEDKENKAGSPNKKNSIAKQNKNESDVVSENLLFKIKLDDEEMDEIYCKFKDLRPRARTEIDVEYLKVGETVLINHNIDHPLEKGYWYNFKVANIEKRRNQYNLVGTLYLGQHAIPQDDTTVRVHDKIFRIEKPRLLSERSEEDKQLMKNAPEKRSKVLNCLKCRDVEDKPCNECGCYICCGKNDPENILLCDECNNGFHMSCLSPPMTEIPEEDWYCPSCKRDSNDVVAPGAAKQAKKTSATKSNRDWGRGMACVGKTKDCAMPANHFGPIPGIEVGMCWRFRFQASEVGVHRPLISGIHGRDEDGAYSIVLSGGYEDDVDNGEEFTYTGSGGRDLSGNKRTAVQSSDQKLTRQNKALARNCPVKLSESGGDAGENWQKGKPVRVIRSYKTLKHCEFAPVEGIRYDGIYKVVKYYPETGLSGFRVWKYLLRRDDPSPAPWAPDAKKFPIIYPDGFLEAEAEKKANKNKKAPGSTKKNNKRTLQSTENELPSKKRKTEAKGGCKTKDCAMSANHFGPIPGIEVGMCWRFRFQASEVGVHRPLISGIHSRDEDGAYSIVLSGGYEDDVDNGEEFTYTGSGGRDLSGNKRTAVQSSDQKLTRQNKALARNCPVKLSESGGDAGENWQKGKPVRVIRSYKTLKHCEFAPVEGIRYDGIYKVVKYYPETGLSGFRVWKYLLRRDDPSPAPWAPDAKKFPIIYPDGFLEAEAEKKANKNKKAPGSTKKNNKRTLQSTENELPSKKRKTEAKGGLKEMFKKGLKTSPVEKVDKNKSKGSEIASKSLSDDETSTEDEKPLKNGTKDEDEEDDLPKRRTRQSAAKMKIESDSDEAEDSEDEDNSAKDKSTNGVKNNSEDVSKELQLSLSAEEMDIIKKDTRNNKLWSDCLRICEKKTKQEFIQHVTEAFLCIICQSMAVNPVTTPCLHNFCMKCIMRAFKTAKIEKCPYCRHKLDQDELESNEELRSALRMLLPGYDAGRQ